jgi:hypothetical protein
MRAAHPADPCRLFHEPSLRYRSGHFCPRGLPSGPRQAHRTWVEYFIVPPGFLPGPARARSALRQRSSAARPGSARSGPAGRARLVDAETIRSQQDQIIALVVILKAQERSVHVLTHLVADPLTQGSR